MPDKIDVMTNPIAEAPYFDVNIAVDFVNIAYPVGVNKRANNGYQKNKFLKGDSLRLLSCGIRLPESFAFFNDLAMGLSLPILSIVPEGVVSGHLFTNPNLSNGYQYIPLENYETVMDVFLGCKQSIDIIDPTKTLLDENYYLRLYIANIMPVSMLGVPALLNGKRFYIAPFMKVLHNFDLI